MPYSDDDLFGNRMNQMMGAPKPKTKRKGTFALDDETMADPFVLPRSMADVADLLGPAGGAPRQPDGPLPQPSGRRVGAARPNDGTDWTGTQNLSPEMFTYLQRDMQDRQAALGSAPPAQAAVPLPKMPPSSSAPPDVPILKPDFFWKTELREGQPGSQRVTTQPYNAPVLRPGLPPVYTPLPATQSWEGGAAPAQLSLWAGGASAGPPGLAQSLEALNAPSWARGEKTVPQFNWIPQSNPAYGTLMTLLQGQGVQATELEKARIQANAHIEAQKPSASRLMEGLIAKRLEQNLPISPEWVMKTRGAVEQAYLHGGMQGQTPGQPRPAITPPPGSMAGASAPGSGGNTAAPAPTQVGARERMLEALGTAGDEIALLTGEKTNANALSYATPHSLLSKIASTYGGDEFITRNFDTLWPFIVSQYGREAVRDWINPGWGSQAMYAFGMPGGIGKAINSPAINPEPVSEKLAPKSPENAYRRLVREQLIRRGLWNPQQGNYDPNAVPAPPRR